MLLKMNGIGKQKLKYKNHEDLEFDSLSNYLMMAKKAISKFANNTYQGLSKKMLNDEDAVSHVANAMMMADWRWDENYENKDGTKKTKYSYRNQCALWAIQSYTTKNSKKSKYIKNVYSLDNTIDGDNPVDIYQFTPNNNQLTPDAILENKEDKDSVNQLIDKLLNSELLSERQKEYIRLYYFENYTFEKIGKRYQITREAVRQGLNKAMQLIRSCV
jgi:RNA polymerase sigma factor (sigma-70 family)